MIKTCDALQPTNQIAATTSTCANPAADASLQSLCVDSDSARSVGASLGADASAPEQLPAAGLLVVSVNHTKLRPASSESTYISSSWLRSAARQSSLPAVRGGCLSTTATACCT